MNHALGVKLVQLAGSSLFLAGAFLYVFDYSREGSYVYLGCAFCFATSSIMDLIEYKRTKNTNQ